MITQSELKELLNYDPATGLFTWRELRQGREAGSIAGSFNNGYITIGINGDRYKAHRLAWLYVTGGWPKDQIDHINHNGADNRIVNLREATSKENQRNRPLNKNNKSGSSGVVWNKADKKWHARIKTNGKQIHLGSFDNLEDAVDARKLAEIAYGYHENHGRRDYVR